MLSIKLVEHLTFVLVKQMQFNNVHVYILDREKYLSIVKNGYTSFKLKFFFHNYLKRQLYNYLVADEKMI